MTNYITSSDVTSTIWQDFNMTNYVDRTNEHLQYLAETLGLTSADIANPIHSVLKEYGCNYCKRQMAYDKVGANNLEVSVQSDKYFVLYQLANDECERLRKYLTPELIKNTATSPEEYSPTVTIYRG